MYPQNIFLIEGGGGGVAEKKFNENSSNNQWYMYFIMILTFTSCCRSAITLLRFCTTRGRTISLHNVALFCFYDFIQLTVALSHCHTIGSSALALSRFCTRCCRVIVPSAIEILHNTRSRYHCVARLAVELSQNTHSHNTPSRCCPIAISHNMLPSRNRTVVLSLFCTIHRRTITLLHNMLSRYHDFATFSFQAVHYNRV